MTVCEIDVNWRSCYTLVGIIVSDSKFVNVLMTMLTSENIVELEYEFRSCKVQTEEVGASFKASNSPPNESSATKILHMHVTKIMMRCQAALKFVSNEALNVIGPSISSCQKGLS